jgi:hypothetical protein
MRSVRTELAASDIGLGKILSHKPEHILAAGKLPQELLWE